MDDDEKVLKKTDFESEERSIVKVGDSKGITLPAYWFKLKRFLQSKVVLSLVRDEKGRLCVLIERVEEF